MSISSLYQDISQKNINVNAVLEPPPIIKSDVSQYANIMSKKAHLNTTSLIKEDVAPAAAPAAARPAAPTAAPAVDLMKLAQTVAQKYNSQPEQIRNIVIKILQSLQ